MKTPTNRTNLRALKRMENQWMPATERARERGEADAFTGRPAKPRLPPGYRKLAYLEGYNYADPMGQHMGRNY